MQDSDFINNAEFKKLLKILANFAPLFEQLKTADTDGNGRVSTGTARAVLSKNQDIDEELINMVLNDADANGRGQVELLHVCLGLASSAADAPSRVASPRTKSRKHRSGAGKSKSALKSPVTSDGPVDGSAVPDEAGDARAKLASPQADGSNERSRVASPANARSKLASPQQSDNNYARAKLASPAASANNQEGLVSPPSRESRKKKSQTKGTAGSVDGEFQSELLPIMEKSTNERTGTYFPLSTQMTAEELHNMFLRFDAVNRNGK